MKRICLGFSIFSIISLLAGVSASPAGEDAINFDREDIVQIEGYWAMSQDPIRDSYKGRFPFPQPHAEPWPGQQEFLQKLQKIEQLLGRIERKTYRGCAWSRFEDVLLGNSEFIDTITGIGWTDSFGPYYVGKFNVKPSRAFYRYVMNFSLATPS